jgi:hypothetical protein
MKIPYWRRHFAEPWLFGLALLGTPFEGRRGHKAHFIIIIFFTGFIQDRNVHFFLLSTYVLLRCGSGEPLFKGVHFERFFHLSGSHQLKKGLWRRYSVQNLLVEYWIWVSLYLLLTGWWRLSRLISFWNRFREEVIWSWGVKQPSCCDTVFNLTFCEG